MKESFLNKLFLSSLLVLFSACNKDSGGGAPAVATTCTAGQVFTQYGCLAQGSCPVGQGMYNNQCIPGSISGAFAGTAACAVGQVSTQYGCINQGTCPIGMGQYGSQCIPAFGGGISYPYGYPVGGYYPFHY